MRSLLVLHPDFTAEALTEWSAWARKHGGQILLQNQNHFLLEHDAPFYFFIWPLQQWRSCEVLHFQSIKEAQSLLRHWGKTHGVQKWVTSSLMAHRRTQLILDGLPELKLAPMAFPEGPAQFLVGGFCLVSESELWVSAEVSPPVWKGEWKMQEDKSAPSRAYLKLWEFFTRVSPQRRPGKGQLCVDMGSAPGGWTWVLANLGSQVISVDKAELDPRFNHHKLVEIRHQDAFQLKPQDLPDLDWFFSDVICEPRRLLEMIQKWHESGLVKNFVCTMKFKGQTDFDSLEKLLQIPGSHAVHLFHNKHEVTWYKLA